jgi:hypothetical protein
VFPFPAAELTHIGEPPLAAAISPTRGETRFSDRLGLDRLRRIGWAKPSPLWGLGGVLFQIYRLAARGETVAAKPDEGR